MSPSEILLYAAIAVLVIWRVIIRQLRGSMLTVRGLALIPGILVIIGVVNCTQVLATARGGELALFGVDLVVLIALGTVRAASTKLSAQRGYAHQKGSTLTLILWLVTIVVRIGIALLASALGVAGPLTSASIVLSMGLSIAAQNVVVYLRARRAGLVIAADRSQLAMRP